jgi:ribonuclease BN (tRNA processing enzyme)
VKLTIIGCSGSVPGPASAASSYLIEHDGYRLLLDLGSGAFGALQRHLDPADLDAAVLSHLHPDHFFDVAPMVVHRRFGARRALPRIPLLGPSGTHDRIAMAYDPAARNGLRDLFDVAAVTPGERELGPFRLRFARMNHPVPTHGVRVTAAGRSLAYSADTGPTSELVSLARGADVLLCEASFAAGTNPPDMHLTGREAGEHAARAGVGRLLVTHIPPWIDTASTAEAATEAFGGPTDAVAAGEIYEL